MAEFSASDEVVTLGLSLFVLGFALGPLVWAPMSELYGRQVVYLITFGIFTFFNAATCGPNSIATMVILRFFAGAFGSSPLTNAGGTMADLFTPKERGLAMSIFALAPFMGPVLGPIIGGFLAESQGWRWVHGLITIFSGVLWLVGIAMVPETYAPVLLRQRAAALSKHTGDVYLSRIDADQGEIAFAEVFKTSLARPWILLFREPIVLLLSIYMAIIYGTLYMLFGAYPIVYQQGRGWSIGIGGLPFIAVAVGMLIAFAYNIFFDDKQYRRAVDKGNGKAPPEARLPSSMLGAIALPIGLFWFAWTNSPSLHWMASVSAGVPFGFGMVLLFLSIMNYLIDAYTIFAASVLAGNGIIRSLFGAVFPLFTAKMYSSLGIHWASTIPAILALLCLPFPFIFYKYGRSIRLRCKYAAEAEEFMNKLQGDQESEGNEESDGSSLDSGEKPEASDEIAQKELEASQDVKLGAPSDAAELSTENLRMVRSARSERSLKSVKSSGTNKGYEVGPYDIDRINTRDSFRGTSSRQRSVSAKRTKE